MLHAVENWLNIAVSGIEDHIEETLYEYQQEGEEINRQTIEALIDSSVKLSLTEGEYHVTQAILLMTRENIDMEYLLNEYGETDE